MKLLPRTTKAKPNTRRGRGRKGDGTLKLRGHIWHYRIPDPNRAGKHIEGSCKTGDLQEAIIEKARAITAAREQHKARIVGTKTISVSHLMNEYYEEREMFAKSRQEGDPEYDAWSAMGATRTARMHVNEILGSIEANNLSTDDILHYRRERQKVVRFSTVNTELSYLRAALVRASRHSPPKVTHVPYFPMPSTKSCAREGFIERAEGKGYREILNELHDTLKCIHVCAFHCACRRGELLKAQWDQVNWERNLIDLRPKTVKTAEGRTIPIWGDMREWLLWQKAIRDRDFPDCPWVFFWHLNSHSPQKGDRLTGFSPQYKQAAIRAGFTNAVFHDLRRSGIRYAIQDVGIDSTIVRHMSGHKTDAMLTRYNIRSTREMQDLGRALDQSLKRGDNVVDIRQPA